MTRININDHIKAHAFNKDENSDVFSLVWILEEVLECKDAFEKGTMDDAFGEFLDICIGLSQLKVAYEAIPMVQRLLSDILLVDLRAKYLLDCNDPTELDERISEHLASMTKRGKVIPTRIETIQQLTRVILFETVRITF